jgi:hypothetical protein
MITAMGDLLKLIWYAVAGLFRSRGALQTEVLVLRHQLNVLMFSCAVIPDVKGMTEHRCNHRL